jgi:hypothetical protein
VLDCTRLERLARDKPSGLLGPFLSYEKIKCCEYDRRKEFLRMTLYITYVLEI